MRKIISAIIIDPHKQEHDFNITYDVNFSGSAEKKIEIITVENIDNFLGVLHKNRGIDAIITIGKDINFTPLNNMSFEFRKKWVHFDEFDKEKIANAIISTFLFNINRDRGNDKLFSIFTCTFNTPKYMLLRLYNSLCFQTYRNWNWWILDDSNLAGSVCEYIEKFKDPRIHVIKNISNHGNIGYNKHIIASACDGDYLVEVDHDDELTSNCLELLKKAFDTYDDCDFVYSHAFEELDGAPVIYDEEKFALGQSKYSDFNVNGKSYHIAESPDINALTVRHIVGLPNHVRCWEKNFYHKIGGHNIELSVLDDMDLLIRTFLYGKMCKINEVLYIQHEGSSKDGNGRGSTTQGSRLPEIQRVGALLKKKYDKQIHVRLKELGVEDSIWNGDDENGYSNIIITRDYFPKINYILQN